MRARIRRLAALCVVGGRFLRRLYQRPDVPRWAKWGITVALLPVPGPFDEIVGAVVVGVLLVRHRGAVEAAWSDARGEG